MTGSRGSPRHFLAAWPPVFGILILMATFELEHQNRLLVRR
jgi:hypothetical protein